MGIEVQEATPALLLQLNLPQALSGLIVTGIAPHGPAELAGLQVGDIITGLNGNTRLSARAAMNQIAALRPGDGIDINYIRDGETKMAIAVAGQRAQPKL
jgi:serine protease DegS